MYRSIRALRLLATGIADASFAINDAYALAQPLTSPNLSHLLLINTATGKMSSR